MTPRLRGVLAPVLTPFDARLDADVPRFVAHCRWLVAQNASLAIFVQFLLSIVLSLLILWDLPSLERGVQSLATGRTSEVYAEIAPSITAFGVMLGRAFEAQTLIAVVNAALTSTFSRLDITTIGIEASAGSARTVAANSQPSIVGIIKSSRIAPGMDSLTRSSATRPLRASITA